MCDPLSLGLTALGAVGSVGSSMAQAKVAKKQANEVNTWTQQQKKFRQDEQGRQEDLRQGAEQAQQQGLEQIAGDAQAKRQGEEEARLSDYLQGQGEASNVSGTAPVSMADKAMLSGQDTGEKDFKNDLAKKISEASADAKQRIGALARVGSYGGSYGGLGTTNPLFQAEAGSAIDRQNEFRRGSLGAYNVERAITPVQETYEPSPMAGVFDAAMSLGTSGVGNAMAGGGGIAGALSKKFGSSTLFPAAPAVKFANYATKGATSNAWQGLRF